MNTAGPHAVGTVADLHASASRITGLTDFGPDDYTDGLGVLLESYARDAGADPAGAKAARALLRGALVARLLSEAGWQSHPDWAAAPAERPVFVTGLPRTGTTALHRLLVADPAHQGLELWLAEAPQPRPPRPAWADDPVFQYVAGRLRPAPRGASRVHGGALHRGRPGRGVLAAAAAVDALGLLRVPGPPAGLLGVAAGPGLDRRVPAAPPQPAADRAERRRPPLGAEEPEPPVRAGRAAGGLPGRAGDPDAPGAAGGDRVRVQPGRAGLRRLVGRRSAVR